MIAVAVAIAFGAGVAVETPAPSFGVPTATAPTTTAPTTPPATTALTAMPLTTTVPTAMALTTPAWCFRAEAVAARGSPTGAALEELLATLPPEAAPIGSAARKRASEDGVHARAWELAVGAVHDGCAVTSRIAATDAKSAAADVAAIVEGDRRFGGVREGDDLIDRILLKVRRWLVRLFETSGMRAFSDSARIVYLSVLAVVAVVVAVRVARTLLSAQRQARAKAQAKAAGDGIERRRKRAFDEWRADAKRALDAGDARTALRAGQAALLARIGELDAATARVVSPARTGREIVTTLLSAGCFAVARAVHQPLSAFDVAYFGKDAAVDDAAAFLKDVDDAEAILRTTTTTTATRAAHR